MPKLEGVNIGPLDPSKADLFSQAAGGATARLLIRHHASQYPPELLKGLTLPRNHDRTPNLVLSEVAEAVRGALPPKAKITGAAIHGEDDAARQYLTFTYEITTKAAAAWSGKGAVEYDGEELPKSHARGSKAREIREARESGLPWHPTEGVLVEGARSEAEPAKADTAELDALQAKLDDEREQRDKAEQERDALQQQLRELAARVAVIESEQVPGPNADAPAVESPAGAAGGEDHPAEPWEGFEGTNAAEVVKRLRESGTADEARLVVAYEEANARRGTVLAAANVILDHSAS